VKILRQSKWQNIWLYLSGFWLFLPMPANAFQASLTTSYFFILLLLSSQGASVATYSFQMGKLRPWNLSILNMMGPCRAGDYCKVDLKLLPVPREGQRPLGRW
jgi:hypothetical protein